MMASKPGGSGTWAAPPPGLFPDEGPGPFPYPASPSTGETAAPPESCTPPPTSMCPSAKPELLSMVDDRLADLTGVYHKKIRLC